MLASLGWGRASACVLPASAGFPPFQRRDSFRRASAAINRRALATIDCHDCAAIHHRAPAAIHHRAIPTIDCHDSAALSPRHPPSMLPPQAAAAYPTWKSRARSP
jgi:hypothetical protein